MKRMVYDPSANVISQLHRPITIEDTKNVVKELFAIHPSDSDNFTKVLRNKIPVLFKLSQSTGKGEKFPDSPASTF